MNEQQILEDYKAKVKDCLKRIQHCSEAEIKELMTDYELDLKESSQTSYPPEAMALQMVLGF